MPENVFVGSVAATFDARWAGSFAPEVVEPAVRTLAELAGSGAALEFGVGTGRLALPLSRAGVPVAGLELSAAMVEQLRAKPGGDTVAVTIGDFATTRVKGTFSLVFLVRNTITNLTTQAEQVSCFENAAAHLEPGGCFVIENYIPALRQLPPGQTVRPFEVTPTHLGFEEYDLASQIALSHHYWFVDGQVDTFTSAHRYVWPSELDLMARLAGLELRARWADWHRQPFTADSESHISIWTRAA